MALPTSILVSLSPTRTRRLRSKKSTPTYSENSTRRSSSRPRKLGSGVSGTYFHKLEQFENRCQIRLTPIYAGGGVCDCRWNALLFSIHIYERRIHEEELN